MNTDYSILGLKQGASQAEIKKAYFKMVRLHSPESDPEKFQEIRQAYEHLKRGQNKADGPVFAPLTDPRAVKMLNQIQNYRKEKNLTLYRDTCEEAWKLFPDSLQFLYLLIMAQRRCGNTGKAVKNAELLVSKEPDNQWFHMALAYSYKERGFTQKAYHACAKAYELGCRTPNFLIMYASFCDDNQMYDQGVSVLLELVRQDIRWSKEDVHDLMDAYCGLLSMEYYRNSGTLAEILDRLHGFLSLYGLYIKEFIPQITHLIATACMNVANASAEYNTIMQIYDDALKICREPDDNKLIQKTIELFYYQRLLADSRIDDTLISYLELLHDFDDEDYADEDDFLIKFDIADYQLCMIQEREEILEQAKILEQEHPHEYEKIADFIAKLKDESKLHLVKSRLLKTYQRLQPFFSDGNFYERYPEEKIKTLGSVINEGFENEPYVKKTKKISRNDPCPCGSGKKYKHCCMNK